MAIMTHAKFHFNWLMLTLIFGIWASEPPRAWRTTEKAGPDRVKSAFTWRFDFNKSQLHKLIWCKRSSFLPSTKSMASRSLNI